jgi:lipopolysaccharide export system permease protein
MARLFVVRSLAVLAMLVLVLMSLDLLGESGKILAVPGNDQADVLRYVSMRVPAFFGIARDIDHFRSAEPE